MRGGDLVAGKQLLQRFRVAMGFWRCHHQLRTDQQRPEEFPHRNVEAARGFLQHHVVGLQRIAILHPQQAIDDGFMPHQHAFRATGRT